MAEIDLTTLTGEQLRKLEYEQQLTINRLQRLVYELAAGDRNEQQKLLDAQGVLFRIRQQIVEKTKQQKEEQSALPAENEPKPKDPIVYRGGMKYEGESSQPKTSSAKIYRGMDTTGLEVKVRLQMAHVPTAIYHLLNNEKNPLLTCEIRTNKAQKKRLRISSFIEGYSARAITTIEVSNKDTEPASIKHLPTLFSEQVSQVHELTRATLNVLAEDLDTGKVEEHQTHPIWLLARNAAPLAVKNPDSNVWVDLSSYYGAFVTPNHDAVMDFVRTAVEFYKPGKFKGYLDGEPVTPQVKAIYDALQQKLGVHYVNSIISFNPDAGARSQRVRLPSECLEKKMANCIDGVLLFASLLEAISLNPVIVIIPNHALVGWEQSKGQWRYLETTCISDNKDFDQACAQGEGWTQQYEAEQKKADDAGRKDELWFRRWSLNQLRTEFGIFPME